MQSAKTLWSPDVHVSSLLFDARIVGKSTTTGIVNDTLFANIGAYKTLAQREKDNVKEFSRIEFFRKNV
jgi:hypothetical protein